MDKPGLTRRGMVARVEAEEAKHDAMPSPAGVQGEDRVVPDPDGLPILAVTEDRIVEDQPVNAPAVGVVGDVGGGGDAVPEEVGTPHDLPDGGGAGDLDLVADQPGPDLPPVDRHGLAKEPFLLRVVATGIVGYALNAAITSGHAPALLAANEVLFASFLVPALMVVVLALWTRLVVWSPSSVRTVVRDAYQAGVDGLDEPHVFETKGRVIK